MTLDLTKPLQFRNHEAKSIEYLCSTHGTYHDTYHFKVTKPNGTSYICARFKDGYVNVQNRYISNEDIINLPEKEVFYTGVYDNNCHGYSFSRKPEDIPSLHPNFYNAKKIGYIESTWINGEVTEVKYNKV